MGTGIAGNVTPVAKSRQDEDSPGWDCEDPDLVHRLLNAARHSVLARQTVVGCGPCAVSGEPDNFQY